MEPAVATRAKEPMQYNPANPLIVQGDRTVLLEVDNPRYAEARDALAPFAELEKSPEHIHTYRLSPLSLWNAAAAGHDRRPAMVDALARTYSKFPLPPNLAVDLASWSAAMVGSGSVRVDGAPPAGLLNDKPRCWKNSPAARRSGPTSASGSTRPASPSTTPSGASSSKP